MSGGACCDRRAPSRPRLLQRGLRTLPWLAPGVGLVLLPKCPACFAAWLAVATGLGVTATAAAQLRIVLTILCLTSAIYALVRIRRSAAQRAGSRH